MWLTLPFYDFCGFRSVAVNSVYKVQFFTFIFAVLLPVLSRLLIMSIIICQMHLTDYLITLVSVRVCVCPPIGCRTITSAILYRFSPNFACCSEMWLFRTLLFLGQTGSRLPILEMCKIRFWQFRDCGGHIFHRSSQKTN